MSKIVQVAGGPFDEQLVYTGPARELRVDESNHDLLIHDGVTAGGHRVLSQGNADVRYQGRSAELDGLAGFTPEQKGFPVRLGPSDYRIRKITVNIDQLMVTNADGFAGDPVIGLAAIINTDHTWDGQHIFRDVVQFNAGINADVSGDTSGTHTGPVFGDVSGDLTGDSAGVHNGQQIGPVDVRGNALLLDDAQIAQTKINGLSASLLQVGVPVGGIILWSGSVASIPVNYRLCDGANGTPNLVGKFIPGAGGVGAPYTPGTSGGSDGHAHTMATDGAHDHGLSIQGYAITEAEMPAHSHGNGVSDDNVGGVMPYGLKPSPLGGNMNNASGTRTTQGITETIGGSQPHSHVINVPGNGAHGHTTTAVDHRPQFYALAYIMRVS